MTTVPRFLVTLGTPGGEGSIEVPTFQGPDAAGRRAFWTAASAGWGDLDEMTVTSVERLPDSDPS